MSERELPNPEMERASVMPAPWFRAQNTARCVSEFGRPDVEPFRTADSTIGERQLGPFVLPPFQRPPVWTREQQIRLIESMWNGLPIGAYVFNQTTLEHPCDGWLLDGQQRVTAILAYLSGEFRVYGWRFTDLPLPEKRGFMMMPISALITNVPDAGQCKDIYDRLAYGGTPHDAKESSNGFSADAALLRRMETDDA